MIVATVGEKGGTGKSTIATNLAGLRSAVSDVVLVDADRQGTASTWVARRLELGNGHYVPACVQSFGDTLARSLRDMATRYQDVIVDVASGDNIEMFQAIAAADAVVVPVQPSGFDLWTMGQTDVRVEQALYMKPDIRAFAVLNRAPPNIRVQDTEGAREALVDGTPSLLVVEGAMRERISYKRAGRAGLTVMEYRPVDRKASNEIGLLYQVVYGEEYKDNHAQE